MRVGEQVPLVFRGGVYALTLVWVREISKHTVSVSYGHHDAKYLFLRATGEALRSPRHQNVSGGYLGRDWFLDLEADVSGFAATLLEVQP